MGYKRYDVSNDYFAKKNHVEYRQYDVPDNNFTMQTTWDINNVMCQTNILQCRAHGI